VRFPHFFCLHSPEFCCSDNWDKPFQAMHSKKKKKFIEEAVKKQKR